jgi:hypothetical protein
MKSLSRFQVGTLRYIDKMGVVSMDTMRSVNQITLWSLVYRSNTHGPLLYRTGDSVRLTPEGKRAVAEYDATSLAARKRESDLSDRVQVLLALVRKRASRRNA